MAQMMALTVGDLPAGIEGAIQFTVPEKAERGAFAPVERAPYPHLLKRDALSPETYQALLAAWPERAAMAHEPGHDRWWYPLQREGIAPEWNALLRTAIVPLIEAAAQSLRPYYAARFEGPIRLFPRHLQLHEAGPGFVEHTPHTHFVHNPEYAFTVLLRLDDGGANDRGTTLYKTAHPNNSVQEMLNIFRTVHDRKLATDVPFEPNSLLAFVDSPVSIHGSTPFEGQASGARKMVLCHVAAAPECVADRTTFDEKEFQARIDAWGGSAETAMGDPEVQRWFERERAVLDSWRATPRWKFWAKRAA